MDIAKYAGLFFLRSEYIYLPGIGNLDIKKESSRYDSETKQIVPGEVSIHFKPSVGVIDDAFANFVANNERISIASAANAISDFGYKVKKEVADKNEVEIPGIGSFYNNNGTIDFRVNDHYVFVPKSIPVFKNVSRTEEFAKEKDIKTIIENTQFKHPSAHEEIELEKPKVNYAKLIMLILLILVVLGVVSYIVYQVINENKTEVVEAEKDIDPTVINKAVDSAEIKANDSIPAASDSGPDYKIIVNEYNNLTTAESRKNRLESYKYNSEVVTKDSNMYLVLVNVPKINGEQQRIVDSIKALLNPRFDVRIYE